MAGDHGLLSIVSTPIGNLDDITLRALRVLGDCDLIVAEDTRRTRRLCTSHGISTRLRSFHAHSSDRTREGLVKALQDGSHLALVTDAGTPLISDPGLELVAAAVEAGVPVETIPGASAVTAALGVAALPCDEFRFVGFLPRTGGKRRDALSRIAADTAATVMYESPTRIAKTLRDLAAVLAPTRRLAVCRELTKIHEEVLRGTAADLAERLKDGTRGEITVVVGRGDAAIEESPETLDEAIERMLADGGSVRDIARALAADRGLARRSVYARARQLADKP